jgi:hypothetical protein
MANAKRALKAKPKAVARAKTTPGSPVAKAVANAKARARRAAKRANQGAQLRVWATETRAEKEARLFECSDLALCVMEAMVHQRLVTRVARIPEPVSADDDDLHDESESWRDRVFDNQTEAIERLVAELARHKDKLPQVTELTGVLIDTAEDYEPEIWSLAGIEACTGLEKIDLWSCEEKLDLSPLTTLPRLAELDLSCATGVKDLRPLFAMPALNKVTGSLGAAIADQLRRRGVEVELK